MGPDRIAVWLVSPAWGRFAVTRLALAQRAHLAGELAPHGIDCQTVIVADDENLDIARGHGFHTVEVGNDDGLGRKFNAGYQHAAAHGATHFVHIGSDDWIHPDAFLPLLDEPQPAPMWAGRRIAFVDLLTGQMRRVFVGGSTGVIPWIVPRHLMERCDFAPIRPERSRGMDGYLVRGLRHAPRARMTWKFHDPHELARVDFKSDVGLNTYAKLPGSFRRRPEEDPWPALSEHYPDGLVELAKQTHHDLQGGTDAEAQEPRRPDRQRVRKGRGGTARPRVHRP